MATVITRANNVKPALLLPTTLGVAALVLALPVSAGELTTTPALSVATHAYGIKNGDSQADRGVAYELSPSLNLDYRADWFSSQLSLNAKTLAYNDAQRDGEIMPGYNWANAISLLNKKLTFNVNVSQQYSQLGALTNRFRDAISNPEGQAKSRSQSAAMAYSNQQLDWANLALNLSHSRMDSDQVNQLGESSSTLLGLANQMSGVNLELRSRSRATPFYYAVNGEANKTNRELLDDQYNRRVNAVIGIPFFWDIGMLGSGAIESNSELTGTEAVFGGGYQNYKTIGGGLEWKISGDSFWNVTYNTITTDERKKGYIGTALQLRPSERTELSARLDRRFFGRTLDVKGAYRLKHLRIELSASDNVGSILGFSQNNLQSALFICPPGVLPGLDNCFQPPTLGYVPAPGESLYNLLLPGSDLSELISVRRNHSITLGYDFNRLKLLLSSGLLKDTFVERRSVNENAFTTASANWQLNRRNSVTLALDFSNVKASFEGEPLYSGDLAGISRAATLTWSRKINPALSADFSLKRIHVSYRGERDDYAENRAWLMAYYRF